MTNDPGGAAYKAAALRNQTPNVISFTSVPAKAPARTPHSRSRRLPAFTSVEAMVDALKPEVPVHGLRPHVIRAKAQWFIQNFPGDVLFAVKTNPDPRVLATLVKAGVRHFDVASLSEIRLTAAVAPAAELYYMHPVKPREAIAEAYFVHGVRHFSLDSHEELAKIIEATGGANDLALHVRLSIPNDKAAMSLAGKFGVPLGQAASLMQATSKAAARFGICFHVGSQCMDPQAYGTTLGYVRDLLTTTNVKLDMIDVGGGFPSVYPGMVPPAMGEYMEVIRAGLKTLPIDEHCQVLCEPGRALVAEGGSTVVRVELRKGDRLYINDGSFGSLYDAAHTEFMYPVKGIRREGELTGELKAFSFFGPTCDSADMMPGPFMLPADIREGDWIEIGQLGAYGATMRTNFNGFWSDAAVELKDEPILSTEL